MSQRVFIDFEASSLFNGYPIEVGIATLDLDTGAIDAEARLIRPSEAWRRMTWDLQAEKIHGISLETLTETGADAAEAAQWTAERLSAGRFYSDAPDFDGLWLALLLEEGGLDRPACAALLDRIAYSSGPSCLSPDLRARFDVEAARRKLQTHRAADDAVGLALTHWLCINGEQDCWGAGAAPARRIDGFETE